MRFQEYLTSEGLLVENIFQKYMKKLSNKSSKVVEKLMKDSWIKLAIILKSNQLEKDALDIINKHFKTNYRNLDQVSKAKIAKMPTKGVYEEEMLVEDFKNYWKFLKDQLFPTLAFWPALKIWLEIDKLVAGSGGADFQTIGIYAIFWVFLVSGKFVGSWNEWKKENSKEYEKEGSRKNPFAVKK